MTDTWSWSTNPETGGLDITSGAGLNLREKPQPFPIDIRGNFSISSFRSKFVPVRPNLFSAQLVCPALHDITDTFLFRVETAEFPGKSIATSEITGGGGPTVRVASDVTYTDVSLTIICSADYAERIFFEKWMNLIYNESSGNLGLLSYYNKYAKDNILTVYQHDSSGKTIYQSIFKEVFPITISAMTANWEERDTYQRFSVSLAYTRAINQHTTESATVRRQS